MIRESGHFEYDENLEGFYDYRLYGEQRIREEGGLFTAHGYVAYHGTIPHYICDLFCLKVSGILFNHFFCPLDRSIREEGGLFTAHGYVAYHGTIPLEELMQADPSRSRCSRSETFCGRLSISTDNSVSRRLAIPARSRLRPSCRSDAGRSRLTGSPSLGAIPGHGP